MDETPFDRPTTAGVAATVRRDALRTLGAAGMALLTMLGLANAADAENTRKKGVEAAGKKKKPGKKGPPGAPGAPGAPGEPGAPGAPGAPGLSNYLRVEGDPSAEGPALSKGASATCPNGSKALGGGYNIPFASGGDGVAAINVFRNRPTSDTVWTVEGADSSGISWSIQAYVICATVATA